MKEEKSKNLFKTISKLTYWIVFLTLVLIACIVAFSALNIPGNYKLLAVQTGSMEPTIKTGSIVLVKPVKQYLKGDIVTFKDSRQPNITVTHRIFDIKNTDNKTFYITKGDANNVPDPDQRTIDQIVGKTIFYAPYIGYLVSFSKTQTGFLLIIIIPATLIIYSELMMIKKEAKKLIQERKKRKLTTKEKIEEKIGEELIAAENEVKGIINKS